MDRYNLLQVHFETHNNDFTFINTRNNIYVIYICLIIFTGNSYTSSSYDDCSSSKELVNVQIQSDDAEIITMSSQEDSQESEKMELNEVISYERIDCALAMHIKYSIDKIYEMSTILQGIFMRRVIVTYSFLFLFLETTYQLTEIY